MATQADTRVVRGAGGFVQVSGTDAIRASVELLFATEPGDVPYDPERGLAIDDLLMLSGAVIVGILEERIRTQFCAYLPTLTLLDVQFDTIGDAASVTVSYRDQRARRDSEVVVSLSR